MLCIIGKGDVSDFQPNISNLISKFSSSFTVCGMFLLQTVTSFKNISNHTRKILIAVMKMSYFICSASIESKVDLKVTFSFQWILMI